MPPRTIYVGRGGSKWGNPVQIGSRDPRTGGLIDAATAVEMFTRLLVLGRLGYTEDDVRRQLAGYDLACWCALTYPDGTRYPCHADVLLEIANAPLVCEAA